MSASEPLTDKSVNANLGYTICPIQSQFQEETCIRKTFNSLGEHDTSYSGRYSSNGKYSKLFDEDEENRHSIQMPKDSHVKELKPQNFSNPMHQSNELVTESSKEKKRKEREERLGHPEKRDWIDVWEDIWASVNELSEDDNIYGTLPYTSTSAASTPVTPRKPLKSAGGANAPSSQNATPYITPKRPLNGNGNDAIDKDAPVTAKKFKGLHGVKKLMNSLTLSSKIKTVEKKA